MYTKHRTSKTHIRWQCVQRNNPWYCKGVLVTSLDLNKIVETKPHTHDATPMEVAAAKTKDQMKRLTVDTARERPAAKLELPASARQLDDE